MRRSPDGIGDFLVIYALAFAFDENRIQELRDLNPNSGDTNKGGCFLPICGNQKDAPIMIQQLQESRPTEMNEGESNFPLACGQRNFW